MKLVIVLVGWLNVGKLIFFNCFMCLCDVIVYDVFGVMCDWYYGEGCYGMCVFIVIDIGGFELCLL